MQNLLINMHLIIKTHDYTLVDSNIASLFNKKYLNRTGESNVQNIFSL